MIQPVGRPDDKVCARALVRLIDRPIEWPAGRSHGLSLSVGVVVVGVVEMIIIRLAHFQVMRATRVTQHKQRDKSADR